LLPELAGDQLAALCQTSRRRQHLRRHPVALGGQPPEAEQQRRRQPGQQALAELAGTPGREARAKEGAAASAFDYSSLE
jgi:hypothetical protein